MKPLSICLILWLFVHGLRAQTKTEDQNKIVDPKFLNHIYYYAGDSLIELEQSTARMVNKTKGFGYGGSESGYEMEGEKSSVRISTGNNIRFAIKLGMSMADPSMMIRLYKLRAAKNKREAILDSQGGMYNRSKNTNSDEISFNIQKTGNDVYLIIPVSALTSGEYGFLNMMMANSNNRKVSFTMFSFGLDQ
ncbi:MAG: hypothetical protein JST75_08480 [Bacteroidetes bacterium]|nr:hypothetical protein [Bacteroidota bacterium]